MRLNDQLMQEHLRLLDHYLHCIITLAMVIMDFLMPIHFRVQVIIE
jgi:hypothetical protein